MQLRKSWPPRRLPKPSTRASPLTRFKGSPLELGGITSHPVTAPMRFGTDSAASGASPAHARRADPVAPPFRARLATDPFSKGVNDCRTLPDLTQADSSSAGYRLRRADPIAVVRGATNLALPVTLQPALTLPAETSRSPDSETRHPPPACSSPRGVPASTESPRTVRRGSSRPPPLRLRRG